MIYSIEPDVVKDINERHETRYLQGVKLNNRIRATGEMGEVRDSEMMIISVPSSAIGQVSRSLKPFYDGQIIVSTSKGVSSDGRLMTEIIEESIGCPGHKVVALSGPSIALEMALNKPTVVVAAGSAASAARVKKVLETKSLIVKTSADKRGIQLLGFYKNIIALLLGICESLEMGSNFEAAIITKAYSEFYHLNAGKRIEAHSFLDFAGLGDLYVTATSSGSRNRRFGSLLASGKSPDEIKREIGQVVEGYENLRVLEGSADRGYIDENLLHLLLRLTQGRLGSAEMKEMLVSYLKSREIKAIVLDWGNVLTSGFYTDMVAGRLSKRYQIEERALCELLARTEGELLKGKQSFQEYFGIILKSFPMIGYEEFIGAYKGSILHERKMLDYCRSLKKRFKLYLLSDNYPEVSGLLRRSELGEIFEGMMFSNEIGDVKPHRRVFGLLAKEFGLSPAHTLYVDDQEGNVVEAEKLGFCAIRFEGIEGLRRKIREIAPFFAENDD
jgi:glycerol-3-phosphate dehydrogenase (NAD(P)+)